jgi:hypothetical protein
MATPKLVVETPEAEGRAAEPPRQDPPKVEPARATESPPSSPSFTKREEPSAKQDERPQRRDHQVTAPKEPGVDHDEFDPMSLPTGPAEETPEDSRFGPPLPADEEHEDHAAPARRRGFGKLIVAVLALAVLGGGGYAAWLNKDRILALVKSGESQLAATPPEEKTGPGVLPPPETPPATSSQPGSSEPQAPKFTQRLNSDGTETDPGPAGGDPGVGEGTSVAAATSQDGTPPAAQSPEAPGGDQSAATGAPGEATPPAAPGTPPAQPPAAQVAVGQKAIFYEERTSTAPGSAESGSVVWSMVQESPGNDLPPEPAIRGEATIPSKDLQLRMTIRRNADQTLPASHIIELIFLTPDGFGGGGIDNILRFALKGTEEAPGSPLMGIPAKIADGFFLIALNEAKQEMEANLNLLRRENWIDVPVIYKNGRRALITMEKGIPGGKIFEEAMKAWQSGSAG